GYDIGRMALLTALEERDGIGRRTLITPLVEEKIGGRVFDAIATLHQRGVSYIASFAPLVFEADAMGDEQAGEILDTNAARLADLINCAHENFAPVGKTLVVSGSIFYQKAFLDRVRERLHYDFDVMPTDMPPVYGACILCCRMSDINENAIAERLRREYKSVTEE
ncbi:MAG: XRE family transcriptional regulator, partial [Clostridia bacterium]|nr:XRE family transcriptional regulator [Clostridia bacterium]